MRRVIWVRRHRVVGPEAVGSCPFYLKSPKTAAPPIGAGITQRGQAYFAQWVVGERSRKTELLLVQDFENPKLVLQYVEGFETLSLEALRTLSLLDVRLFDRMMSEAAEDLEAGTRPPRLVVAAKIREQIRNTLRA